MSDRPTISAKTKVEVLVRQASWFYCRKPLAPSESAVEFDHVKARALGGSDDSTNLVAVHKTCHRDKTNVDLAKIASENRRIKKRTRATEKRALEAYARRMDLQKLIMRGSDLLVDGAADVGTDGSGIADAERGGVSASKKAPRSRWSSRPFGKGRKFGSGGKDRAAPDGGDKSDDTPEQD